MSNTGPTTTAPSNDTGSGARRGRIMVVDDNTTNRDILRRLLRRDFDLALVQDGQECLDAISTFKPQLVLLDVMMPGPNGYEVCRRIKQSALGEFVQVVLVTGKGSTAERLEGYAAGADDYMVKPFDHDELLSKIKVQFRLWNAQRSLFDAKAEIELHANDLERLVSLRTHQLTATQDMVVFALAQLAESRDAETGEHLTRMRFYAQTLAEWLSQNTRHGTTIDERFLQDLYRASPLHDVGKVAVPDCVLQKPGRLTPEEFAIMQRHVLVGADTLARAREQCGRGTFMDMAIDIARYHHERFDGTGYLAGLRGEAIPLSARIVALADVYDALSSKRIYKPAFTPESARQTIIEGSGSHFDPDVVEAFLASFNVFCSFGESAHESRSTPALDMPPVEMALATA